jgi:hypothetical protein
MNNNYISITLNEFVSNLVNENIGDNPMQVIQNKYQQKQQNLIDSITSFSVLDDQMIYKCLDMFGYEGHNDEEDAFEDLKDKIDSYKQMSNPVKLYRVVGVKDSEMINTDNLGEHYTQDLWSIDGDMLMSIGYENWDEDVIPYVIEVLVNHVEIDIKQTLIQNLAFPGENEINLRNNGRGAAIVKIFKLDDF